LKKADNVFIGVSLQLVSAARIAHTLVQDCGLTAILYSGLNEPSSGLTNNFHIEAMEHFYKCQMLLSIVDLRRRLEAPREWSLNRIPSAISRGVVIRVYLAVDNLRDKEEAIRLFYLSETIPVKSFFTDHELSILLRSDIRDLMEDRGLN
jgi:hypothetical protein